MVALENFVSDAEIEALYRPTAEARGLPAQAYVDEAFWQLERETLFPTTWMACAFEGDVAEPGDVCPISIAGWELILTRGQDGAVNVFHNVCAHRAMRVVDEPCKAAKSMMCPWHSWIFDLDGKLLRTPGLGGVNTHEVDGFNADELGLKRVRADTWLGYVFINLDGKAPPLADYLASVETRMADFDLGQLRYSGLTTTMEFEGNWKLAIEGGVEDYHLPWIHPEIGPHRGTFQIEYDPSGTYVGMSSRRPIDPEVGLAGRGVRGTGALPMFPHLANGGVPDDGLDAGSMLLFILPSAVLAVMPNHISTTLFVPLAHNRTQHRRAFHFIGDESMSDGFAAERERVRAGWTAVGAQDKPLVAQVHKQQELRADIGMETRFSPYWEGGVHRFQQMVVERLQQKHVTG
jgi:choline monooxygenase